MSTRLFVPSLYPADIRERIAGRVVRAYYWYVQSGDSYPIVPDECVTLLEEALLFAEMLPRVVS